MLNTFDFQNVNLSASRLKNQFDQIKQEYLGIPNDNLLRGFRLRAGLPAPGQELGGWYSADFFNCFGQIISGLARMYSATGDVNCLNKVNYLIAQWALCLEGDGYFFYSSNPNAPHYFYDKMLGGLLDAYLYCGNTSALTYMSTITDWAIANLDRTRIYAYNAGSGNTEWYTISENIYRAYLATGDIKYRNFAEIWEYTEYWNIFATGGDIFDRYAYYHAYSHVNALGGAGPAYEVKGESWYLDALVNSYDYLKDEQTFATGGYGPEERFLRRDNLIATLQESDYHFETQCGSWAVFKLAKYLLRFTGDARFGDWVELLVFNGIGASIGMETNGEVQYTSNYNFNGGSKTNINAWSCCSGTRPQAAADYYDLTWFYDDDSLYVNLYTPSTVQWNHGGATVTVAQNGELHQGDTITFTVSLPAPQAFAIKLRAPAWLAGPMAVVVNGQPVSTSVNTLHWLEVNRQWQNGDVMQVSLPKTLTAKSLDPQHAQPAAIMYGPIVLAGDAGKLPLAKEIDYLHPNQQLTSTGNSHFTWVADASVELRPFFEFGKNEPYFMYFNHCAAHVTAIKYVGGWNRSINFHYSNEAGAYAECYFRGDAVTWTSYQFDDGGIAHVYVDGEWVAQVDQWSPHRDVPFSWTYSGNGLGQWHHLKILVSGQKRPESLGIYQNITSIVAHEIAGDADGDCRVNMSDLMIFTEKWLTDDTTQPM
ncbi:MAG: glycoside hydrolase family 127 protein [Sedimentisphaerales bacterium]|nr:glycoside hydrolase family 127 protein [Sedimentisphaerales bacterium]